jgi:hypothetical protein
MIAIKINCGCGQRYAFDVEPISGRMPGAVACPVCGVDGTANANAILAERLQSLSAAPASAPAAVRVPAVPAMATVAQTRTAAMAPIQPSNGATAVRVGSAPANHNPAPAAPAERTRLRGQMEPERAMNEARSKIMWGDDPAEVTKFLQVQGFTADEAREALAPILVERAQTVRKAGTSKIFSGLGMMCVPLIAGAIFLSIGFFPIKIFGATVAVGIWGGFRALTGAIMFLSPKSEKGDVSEM